MRVVVPVRRSAHCLEHVLQPRRIAERQDRPSDSASSGSPCQSPIMPARAFDHRDQSSKIMQLEPGLADHVEMPEASSRNCSSRRPR